MFKNNIPMQQKSIGDNITQAEWNKFINQLSIQTNGNSVAIENIVTEYYTFAWFETESTDYRNSIVIPENSLGPEVTNAKELAEFLNSGTEFPAVNWKYQTVEYTRGSRKLIVVSLGSPKLNQEAIEAIIDEKLTPIKKSIADNKESILELVEADKAIVEDIRNIKAKDNAQDQAIALIVEKDNAQDQAIALIVEKDNAQDQAIETFNNKVIDLENANRLQDETIAGLDVRIEDNSISIGSNVTAINNLDSTKFDKVPIENIPFLNALGKIDPRYLTVKGFWKVVTVLPEPADADLNSVYLLKNPTRDVETFNDYTEYIVVEGKWEELGNLGINLDDYYTKDELTTIMENYLLKSEYVPIHVLVNFQDRAGEVWDDSYLYDRGILDTVMKWATQVGQKYVLNLTGLIKNLQITKGFNRSMTEVIYTDSGNSLILTNPNTTDTPVWKEYSRQVYQEDLVKVLDSNKTSSISRNDLIEMIDAVEFNGQDVMKEFRGTKVIFQSSSQIFMKYTNIISSNPNIKETFILSNLGQMLRDTDPEKPVWVKIAPNSIYTRVDVLGVIFDNIELLYDNEIIYNIFSNPIFENDSTYTISTTAGIRFVYEKLHNINDTFRTYNIYYYKTDDEDKRYYLTNWGKIKNDTKVIPEWKTPAYVEDLVKVIETEMTLMDILRMDNNTLKTYTSKLDFVGQVLRIQGKDIPYETSSITYDSGIDEYYRLENNTRLYLTNKEILLDEANKQLMWDTDIKKDSTYGFAYISLTEFEAVLNSGRVLNNVLRVKAKDHYFVFELFTTEDSQEDQDSGVYSTLLVDQLNRVARHIKYKVEDDSVVSIKETQSWRNDRTPLEWKTPAYLEDIDVVGQSPIKVVQTDISSVAFNGMRNITLQKLVEDNPADYIGQRIMFLASNQPDPTKTNITYDTVTDSFNRLINGNPGKLINRFDLYSSINLALQWGVEVIDRSLKYSDNISLDDLTNAMSTGKALGRTIRSYVGVGASSYAELELYAQDTNGEYSRLYINQTSQIARLKKEGVNGTEITEVQFWLNNDTPLVWKTPAYMEDIQSGGGNPFVSDTFANIKALRDSNSLVVGNWYEINDFETTTTLSDTQSDGTIFKIVILAISTNSFGKEGYVSGVVSEVGNQRVGDLIWYGIDETHNNTKTIENGGKGVIYRYIDKNNNDLHYDFKSIKTLNSGNVDLGITSGYYYTFDNGSGDTSNESSVYNNFIRTYTSSNGISVLPKNLFYGTNFSSNTIGNDFSSNTIGNGFGSNTIGNYSNYNTIGNDFSSNTIGTNFTHNTIGTDFNYNTIGTNFSSNTIATYFRTNTIDNYFRSNAIGNGFGSNTIGNGFGSNAIGDGFGSNTIGNGFGSNAIGDYFESNTIGNNNNYLKTENKTKAQRIQFIHIENGVSGNSKSRQLDLTNTGTILTGDSQTTPTIISIDSSGWLMLKRSGLTFTGKRKTTIDGSWDDL